MCLLASHNRDWQSIAIIQLLLDGQLGGSSCCCHASETEAYGVGTVQGRRCPTQS